MPILGASDSDFDLERSREVAIAIAAGICKAMTPLLGVMAWVQPDAHAKNRLTHGGKRLMQLRQIRLACAGDFCCVEKGQGFRSVAACSGSKAGEMLSPAAGPLEACEPSAAMGR